MTKRNSLLAAFGVCALSIFLFAFTAPRTVREHVLTLLFPERNPSIGRSSEFEVQSSKLLETSTKSGELQTSNFKLQTFTAPDTVAPIKERYEDFINSTNTNPYDLRDPKAVEQKVEYDPTTGMYIVTEKIGNDFFRAPTYMTFDEYTKWRDRKQQQEYFDRLQGVASAGGKNTGAVDPIAKFNIKNSLIERLFGGTQVDIRPQGNINLTFGYNYQKVENPILTLRQQRNGIFDFDMGINMSAQGKIGEKLNLNFNYNTQATFDLENQMKLHYDTKGFSEDEILQNIEAGNVSLPLRSNLIKGAQNLFGLKTELKFGHLRTTFIAAQQRSKQQQLTLQGGSQLQTYEKPIDEYDENRHFFVSHWNRAQFEPALKCLPVPISLFTITRMEVWLTNDRQLAGGVQPNGGGGVRDIVALADLGEPDVLLNPAFKLPGVPPGQDIKGAGLPDNRNNTLYPQILNDLNGATGDTLLRRSDKVVSLLRNSYGLKQIRDFEKVQARLLSTSEYSYNEQLGFISVNLNVQPDQVVGVAMEYTYNGIPYKIGEFGSDVNPGDTLNQNVLFVKMLKSTTANVKLPIWDLMMKNVYSIGSINVDPNEFRFDIFYEDPGKGQKRFLDQPVIPQVLRSKPLLQVFRLDTLNLQGDPGPDGIFDFVPGLTINLRSGRVMFPVLEPFGSYLWNRVKEADPNADSVLFHNNYIYRQLYDSTLFRAREFQQLNRFTLKGSYKGSNNSEISLGTFNLPKGSVRVSAGGQQLIEGRDYTVDYNIGRVKILNDAILQSGQNVNVSFEDNTLFGFQNRSMIGARFDYEINKDMAIGGTFMNLFERPLTQKVNFGDDPINNKMYGLDFSITKEAPWLTKLVDKIPLINTKEPSSITSQIEVAALQPGHNRAINQEGGGTVYLDDFEGTTANLRIDFPANQWAIASVPQDDENTPPNQRLFPETTVADDSLNGLINGVNRARLSWYNGGDAFFRSGADNTRPYTRGFNQTDIFPNRQIAPNEQPILRGLDVTMYPRERGPYNFDRQGGYPGFSQGFTQAGELNDPSTRWAGFMKGLNNNDFEASNIEFIEFWMLNPYMMPGDGTPISEEGDMYIDLGSVSEDIMHDSRQFFENALPTGAGTGTTVNTRWGRVPVLPPVVNAFDNDPAKRQLQDLGLDGLDDVREQSFYASWLNQLAPGVRTRFEPDPSADNFIYFGDGRFTDQDGLLERYRLFNNPQGNSPVNDNTGSNNGFNNPSATNLPDVEDLNRDNSLNETESYFRYKLPLKKGVIPDGSEAGLDLNDPILKEIVTETQTFVRNGQTYVWYRFKLPLDATSRTSVGGIQDFRSIRFLRMFWKGFTERTTFRFATIELGRNQWRRFTQSLPQLDHPKGICDIGTTPAKIPFDVNAVSIEENSARLPFNYTIPFGISREQSVGAFPSIQQNEQALSMNVCNLTECDARAIFKTLNMDLRQFKRLKMFVHAEGKGDDRGILDNKDMKVFIRLGSDFVRNYYEYEIPLQPSDENNPNLNKGPDSEEYKKEVWRDENTFDFPFDLLTAVKTERNAKGAPFDLPYGIPDPDNPKNRVNIVGNPNLGYVKGAMIGVRNVDTTNYQPHCVEVWFNELRLNGFNEKGGYAGQARLDMKLADFGNISLAGNYTSIGWGSIEQKLIQRQREEVLQGDASMNVELGKFFGEKSGIRIPFYAQYSNVTRNPEYDPYDLDIKLKDKIRAEADPARRDSIRSVAQDVTVTRGYNFTNVRKERKGGSRKIPMPWNIENFSVTYAYNQTRRRTPFLINDEQNQYKGALDWQYATGMKPITPFKGLIKKDKYLKFISDFNFNPLPNTYGFNSNLERFVGVTTYRFAGEDPKLNTYYNRRFTWDRNYDLGWDITKALRFNFDATARSLIDEPYQTKPDGEAYSKAERRDSIITNLRNLGRPKNYTQNASLNYTLPFKVIPFMDWVTMRASYSAGYTWTAQSLKLQNLDAGVFQDYVNERNLGNVIQNNNTRQINGDFNFEGLYNKSKYLGRINKPSKPGGPGNKGKGKSGGDDTPSGPGGRTPGGRDGGGGLTPGDAGGDKSAGRGKDAARDDKNSRDRNTPTPPASSDKSAPGADGKAGAGPGMRPGTPGNSDSTTTGIAGKNSKDAKSKKDSKAASKDKDGDKKKKDRQPTLAERIAIRPLMLVRKARFTYSENYSTIIPGFTPEPKLMGLSEGFIAPGWEFIAGIQPTTEWLDEAGRSGWITHRPELNQQVIRNYTQNLDAGVTIEPFQDFRVELTANKQYSRNNTELFKDQDFDLGPDEVAFEHRAQRDLGSYTVSYFALSTMFNKDLDGLFARYASYRSTISKRLGVEDSSPFNGQPHTKDGTEYAYGFGKTQQQVLLPAFIAAYTEADPNAVNLNVFKTRPAVNWKLNYNGLSKIGKLKKVFSSVQIQHGYKSTLQVNSYNTDIFYDPGTPFKADEINADYIARYEIPQVVINEQFSPLLGVDVKLKNEMTFKVDFKKQRTLAMSFIDYQLAETQSKSYTAGFGYRLKNVNIPFLTGKKTGVKGKSKSKSKSKSKKKVPAKPTTGPTPPPTGGAAQANDMNFKFDFEIRDDITVNHRLDQLAEATPTRGQRTISINPSVEYALNRRLKLRLFTDYRKTTPRTSQSFPITTLNSGVTIQFSLN